MMIQGSPAHGELGTYMQGKACILSRAACLSDNIFLQISCLLLSKRFTEPVNDLGVGGEWAQGPAPGLGGGGGEGEQVQVQAPPQGHQVGAALLQPLIPLPPLHPQSHRRQGNHLGDLQGGRGGGFSCTAVKRL